MGILDNFGGIGGIRPVPPPRPLRKTQNTLIDFLIHTLRL